MRKFYTITIALLFVTLAASAQKLIYSNNFENGLGGATVVGDGQVVEVQTANFGSVYYNAPTSQAIRTNYLLLPDSILGQVQRTNSYHLSIGFWINVGSATNYRYAPIFSAYAAAPASTGNTWPMMILQARLLAQVNCAGWTDLTNAENVTGTNTESETWLGDAEWHYYTATFDTLSVKVYVDGVVKNSWTTSNTSGNIVKGLFTNGADLKYICLGGNQAWNWNDNDAAFMYDDLAIYSDVLTPVQIKAIMSAKIITSTKSVIDNKELVGAEYYNVSGEKVGPLYKNLKSGIYIKKSIFSDGTTNTTKIVKVLE
jgi:hypothetical protein